MIGVEVDDIVSQGRTLSVCEGSAAVAWVGVFVAPDAGMSSSHGGRGRGAGILRDLLMKMEGRGGRL